MLPYPRAPHLRSPQQSQMVAELEKEVGEQLAAKEKELKEAQKQLEGKARDPHTKGREWVTSRVARNMQTPSTRCPAAGSAQPGACSWLPALLTGCCCAQ